jgi:TPR repeat protein
MLLWASCVSGAEFADLQKRAELGEAKAQFRVAVCYLFGTQKEDFVDKFDMIPETGISPKKFPPKTDKEAVRWMVAAANQKYPPAQLWVGNWMLTGGFQTIRANTKAGWDLVNSAAFQGDGDAMKTISNDFASDKQKKPVECLKWAILAERFGASMVRDSSKLTVLGELMTPAGVREAWKQAEAFKVQKFYAGDYEPKRRDGPTLESLLEVAERVRGGRR